MSKLPKLSNLSKNVINCKKLSELSTSLNLSKLSKSFNIVKIVKIFENFQIVKIVKNFQDCRIVKNFQDCQTKIVKMLVRSRFLITLIKCLKGHKSLGSLCNVKSKSTVSQLVSQWMTRSPIELLWTAKNTPNIWLFWKEKYWAQNLGYFAPSKKGFSFGHFLQTLISLYPCLRHSTMFDFGAFPSEQCMYSIIHSSHVCILIFCVFSISLQTACNCVIL